jgi:hypothetical protein
VEPGVEALIEESAPTLWNESLVGVMFLFWRVTSILWFSLLADKRLGLALIVLKY